MDTGAETAGGATGLRRYKDIGWRDGNHIFPKPGLEHERLGLEFDDAWRLDPRRAA